YPTPTTAGASHTFVVTAFDPFGNKVTGYTGTVHFASPDGHAVLPANYTFTASDAGTHTFTATLATAGTQSITATDTAIPGVSGTESGISVTAAAASALQLTGFPTPTTAGVAQSLTVTAVDAYGNRASGYTGTIHFTSSDSQAFLPANYTFAAS